MLTFQTRDPDHENKITLLKKNYKPQFLMNSILKDGI